MRLVPSRPRRCSTSGSLRLSFSRWVTHLAGGAGHRATICRSEDHRYSRPYPTSLQKEVAVPVPTPSPERER